VKGTVVIKKKKVKGGQRKKVKLNKERKKKY
jgi:hypothetical protein